RISDSAPTRDIVPIGDLAQQSGVGIKERQEESNRCRRSLVDQRRQPGPERRDRTRSAEYLALSVDHNAEADRMRGIAGNVGHAAALLAIVDAGWEIGVLLK